MNPPTINSTNSVSTTRRKREAERSVNWTVEETQVLLCAWSDERVQKSLAENLRNRHVFKHLSARMSEMGFARSPHQCRLRVKTLKANYVRAKLQRSVNSQQPCTFKYFAEMEAVLGRRSTGGVGGALFVSSEGRDPQDFDSQLGGRHFASLGRTRRQRASTLETRGAHESWQLDSEVKLEEGEDSTDEFEVVDSRFPPCPRDRAHGVYLESDLHQEITGSPEDQTPPPPHEAPPPPSPPPPPPRIHSAPSPLPAPPDPSPAPGPEPALKHLLESFQRLVSETRGLLVQLENGRQEQARWHQELLEQWLQREELRQREAAEREERREKARMAHEIRVLELLTGLGRGPGCRCGNSQTGSETPTGPSLNTDKDRS